MTLELESDTACFFILSSRLLQLLSTLLSFEVAVGRYPCPFVMVLSEWFPDFPRDPSVASCRRWMRSLLGRQRVGGCIEEFRLGQYPLPF